MFDGHLGSEVTCVSNEIIASLAIWLDIEQEHEYFVDTRRLPYQRLEGFPSILATR